MSEIRFKDLTFTVREHETVLDVLLRENQSVPHSCRTGVCQTCLLKTSSGEAPAVAQKGLKETLKVQGYFLACQCKPEQTMDILLPNHSETRHISTVTYHKPVSENIVEIRLSAPAGYHYIPGQYLTVWKNEKLGRSYSLASVPQLDGDHLEIHVKRIDNGALSSWLFNEVTTGDELVIQDAIGHCCYVAGTPETPLLLAGTGTGLAPLYGILRDAISQGHRGEIHLFHGARSEPGLYKHDALQALEEQETNFNYHPIVSAADGFEKPILDFIEAPQAWQFYLCGSESTVTSLRKKLFLAGAPMKQIHADAFITRSV